MNFNFNSWNTDENNPFFAGKIPFGACHSGSKVFFRVYARFSDVSRQKAVQLRTLFDHQFKYYTMNHDATDSDYLTCTIELPKKPGLFWYDFQIQDGDHVFFYIPDNDKYGGQGMLTANQEDISVKQDALLPKNMWQLTIYKENRTLPDWYAHGIMYQIFPDRFAKGSSWQPNWFPKSMIHGDWNDSPHYDRNPDGSIERWDYFGGNLEGIIEKLDYLRSLNITILYLNPIFEARSNHKYDTADYHRISPEFGNEETFRQLCGEAEKRGIHIILDGVFSHTGADSIYFNQYGHYSETGACQSETSPYNWYRFSTYPEQYECWWGVTSMPNVEEMTPAYQDFIFKRDDSVIRHWLRAGASGFRLDVADELPDAFISGLKEVLLEEKPDGVLIGEVWEDASRKTAYNELRDYFLGDELDAVMNYPFREILLDYVLGKIGSNEATCRLMALYEHYPKCNFMAAMNLIGSHDRPRVLTLLSGTEKPSDDFEKENFQLSAEQLQTAEKRLMLAAMIQMTFPGVPCIYYGDEAGCQGWDDPYNRGTYPWGKENQRLLSEYRQLTALRTKHPVLFKGDFTPYFTHKEDILAFYRTSGDQRCFCIFNRSLDISYPVADFCEKKAYIDLLKNETIHPDEMVIGPLSGMVIMLP